ncbi:MAG: SPOR domain-containing protein [Phocaeicola sp.]|nr:SPOR domain-containing protein [Phocaeicola sp.]MBR1596163.1 SPOR domain-containing protein [Phocaeicola sp.]
MRYFITLFFLSCALSVWSQSNILEELQRTRSFEGQVTIHQDTAIAALVGSGRRTVVRDESKTEIKTRGYRVQVYAGNNSRVSRNEAAGIAKQVEAEFPDLPVYTYFRPPRWLCRVGDFKTIEEADAAMRRLKATKRFKEVSIVREQINIPIE